MSKKPIKIKFQNGLDFNWSVNEILAELLDEYEFIDSGDPDFIVFGPYGNDIPPKGNYTRIGYFCENIKPDLSVCEWAFGIPREEDVQQPNYKRIQWHGFNPQDLIKGPEYDAEQIAATKTRFCNFLYSHKVSYREAFFTQLSKYKRVDAPGRSMNNMPGIDMLYSGDKWEVKRKFLSPYKFTIAFENDIYPGYQTEKLYDAMLAQSIPVYFGDPFIGEIFNTKSFINAGDYLNAGNKTFIDTLGKIGHMDFEDIRPTFLRSPRHRIKRKIKLWARSFKTKAQFAGMDFSPLIKQIIAIDQQPELYLEYLKQPWLNNNALPERFSTKKRWMEIFKSK